MVYSSLGALVFSMVNLTLLCPAFLSVHFMTSEGPKVGVGILGRWLLPPHQLEGLGSTCKRLSGFRGRAQAPNGFPLF